MSINSDLKNAAAGWQETSAFLSQWQERSDCKLLTRKETLSNNYMVMKDGHLLLWARTIGVSKGQVCIHSRDELVDRMGEDYVHHLEENLQESYSLN